MKLNKNSMIYFISVFLLIMSGCLEYQTPSASFLVEDDDIKIPPNVKGRIAFIWGETFEDKHIYIFDLYTRQIIDITPSSLTFFSNLALSPDGQYIAFDAIKDEKRQIFKVKINDLELTQLTFSEINSSNPSWSSDGSKIVFESGDKNIIDDRGIISKNPVTAGLIYIMNSDGSELKQLIINQKENNVSISGTIINDNFIAISEIITRYAYTNYLINYEGDIQKEISEFSTTTSDVAWSPNGEYVVYTANRVDSPCFGFTLIRIDEFDMTCIKVHEEIFQGLKWARDLSWSPDSAYIIFSSNLSNDKESDIYIIKPDGTNLTQITNISGYETEATWSFLP